MSARTQVYLTKEQRERVDRAARARGVTTAEIIRTALDKYLAEDDDPAAALAATFGSDPNIEVPSRDAWDRG
jgi:predicted DNA-binding protein